MDHRIWVFSELHLRLPSIFLECMSKSFLTNRPTNRPTDWFVQSRARGCKNWLHFLTAGQLDCAPSNAFFGDKATVMLARIPFLSSIKKAFGFSGEQTSKSMLSDSGLKINHVEEIA